MNIFEITRIVNDKKKSIEYLQEKGVLIRRFTCICNREMKLIKKNSLKGDGYIFKCPKKCSSKSVRTGSYFMNSNLPLSKVIMFVFFWLDDLPTKLIKKYLNISSRTAADWNSFLVNVCSNALLRLNEEERKIGGEGIIVEIDETLISKKRKNNRGIEYPQQWLFGGVERNTGRWFGRIVQTRDRNTLERLIIEFIKPNTIIYSDEWAAYFTETYNLTQIPNSEFLHFTVNHNRYFVHPATGVHTNTIEGLWGNLKMDFRKKRGMSFELKCSYLDFKIYQSRFFTENEDELETFWRFLAIN